MPIYEYQCDACDETFDAIQKFSDAPLASCRLCGAERVRKLISAPAFRLKGGGWYETDFKKNNQRNLAKGEGGSTGGSSEGGSTQGSSTEGGSRAASGSADTASGSSGGSGSTSTSKSGSGTSDAA